MIFIIGGAAVLHPGTDGRSAGIDLQTFGQPAAGAQLQADVLLLALLHVGEVTGAVRPGILVGLAQLEQRCAQAQALPVALDADFQLVRQRRGEDFGAVAGEPRCGATGGDALAVAGVQGDVRTWLVDQGGVGQQLIVAGMATRVAILVEGLFVQAHQACAQHRLPLFVETDPVTGKQAVLTTVQATGAGADGLVGGWQCRCLLVNVAAADPFVEIGALVQRAALGTGAERQLVTHTQGIEAAVECGLGFVGATGIVRAAIVIDVIVACTAEIGPFARAPGKRAVIVDHHLAARSTDTAGPVIAEAVFEAPAQVQGVDGDRIGPLLIGQAVVRVDVVGQAGAAQQLIPRHRTLFALLVFSIQLQHGIGVDLPVERQGGEIALAVGVVNVGADVFMGEVGAHTELALTAEPAAKVGGDVAFTLLVARYRHRAHILRAFGDVVDQPAGFGNAALQPGQTLEQFDLLFVLQRHILLAGNGLAVDLVAAGGVEFETAHVEVFVVADRRIAFAHRGIALQYFAELAHLSIGQQLLAEHRHRRWRIEQWCRGKTGYRRLLYLIALAIGFGHLYRCQGDAVLGQAVAGGQGQAQAEQAQRQARAGQGHAKSSLGHAADAPSGFGRGPEGRKSNELQKACRHCAGQTGAHLSRGDRIPVPLFHAGWQTIERTSRASIQRLAAGWVWRRQWPLSFDQVFLSVIAISLRPSLKVARKVISSSLPPSHRPAIRPTGPATRAPAMPQPKALPRLRLDS
ncbi:hypothetical protein D3C77_295680 [compost metagenome]